MLPINPAIASPDAPLAQLIAATTRLQQGDRIVFVGDSITYFGGKSGGYVDRIQRTLADRRDLGIKVSHYGLSGARAADLWVGKTNWSESTPYGEILKTKPTILIIYIGVNDVWHEPATEPQVFRSNLSNLVTQGQQTGAIVILATPAVIGEQLDNNPKHEALEQFSQISRQVATAHNVTLCDLRQAFISYLKIHNPSNRDRGILTSDGVHMNGAGNRLIADCMARSILQAIEQHRN